MDIGREQNRSQLCCKGFESKTAARMLCILYSFVILLTLMIGLVTVRNADDPMLVKIGCVVALVAFSIVAMQVILGSRVKMLDQAFGLDRVVIWHRKAGVIAMVLLLSHPLLIALGQKSMKIFSVHASWPVYLGKGALLLLVPGVLLALYYSKIRQDYNTWRILHKAMILVVILAFTHSMLVGDAFDNNWIKVWWAGLMFFAWAAFFRQNFFVIPFGRKKYCVKSVIQETHDTFSLILEPSSNPGTVVFDFKPGQFMFLALQYKGRRREEHPFTISSSPVVYGTITATIKKSGNYTAMIDQTQAGDVALLQAPFGRFSYYFDEPSCFLFIAAGVGVTPIHSMISTLHHTGDKRPVVLLYSNKTEGDIIFRDEFEKLPANFKVMHILSRADKEWKGLTGHINAEMLKEQAGELLGQADIYLCGPAVMMVQVIKDLSLLGVPESRMHYERFTL